MAEDFIKQAPGGELTAPDGTEALPVQSTANQDYWIQILNLIARKLRETNGPTTLSMGGVADGDFLRRIGSTIIGSTIQGPVGFGQNYQINVSVASNNLTVAMKAQDGNDPSSTNRSRFKVGNTEYELTAATSFTKNAGTNFCGLGSTELKDLPHDVFMYAIGETGASAGLKFGFSRIPYARTMGDFVNTTTNEKYIAGNWTNFNSSDEVAVIGRFRAQLSAAASYNWSIAASVVVNRPIYETDWLSYAAQVTPASGSITTLGTITTTYQIIGRNINFDHEIAITTNGTGAGSVRASLPFNVASGSQIFKGRENASTGNMLQVQLSSNLAIYLTYNNLYPGGSGYVIRGSGENVRLV